MTTNRWTKLYTHAMTVARDGRWAEAATVAYAAQKAARARTTKSALDIESKAHTLACVALDRARKAGADHITLSACGRIRRMVVNAFTAPRD